MISKGSIRGSVFGISPRETQFSRRGFAPTERPVRERLELIGSTFVEGYQVALRAARPSHVAPQLAEIPAELRGFAFEGAAMGMALVDGFSFQRPHRVAEFLASDASPHLYLVHVGVGWAAARVPWIRARIERYLESFDPPWRWLAMDGFGFHEGYFHWRKSIRARAQPRRLSERARRCFDQGLGRSVWFVEGANGARIAESINSFPQHRRSDLWSGVGLASSYAGGAGEATIVSLRGCERTHWPHLAQGAAFAAKARERAGNPAKHTDLACRILCGTSAAAAASVTDVAWDDVAAQGGPVDYEMWRARIRARLTAEEAMSGCG